MMDAGPLLLKEMGEEINERWKEKGREGNAIEYAECYR